nr:pectinesterase family protein [Lactococcus lactis]
MSLDNFKKQTITWDMINQSFEQPIQIMEGDVNARTLLLKITDNGSVLDLTGYSVKLTYQYMYKSQSGFIMLTPNDISKGEFTLIIPTEMTVSGLIKSNLILLNEDKEQVIVSKNLAFISDDSTVTDLAQEVNNKIDDFTKLLLENMPQVMRSELNDLHTQTDSNKSNIELKANSSDMTSLQSAMTELKNEVEAFGISPENLVTIKSLLDAIASNASESEVVELINSVKVLTSNISLMSNGDYSPKANQTDLESLQHTVNDHSATISAKPNQTDLDNLQATVDKQGIAISTKANQTDLNNLQADVSRQGIAISTKVDKSEIDASKLIGWDENAIDISPTGIQTVGTPITITFNKACAWTLSGNMMTYFTSENVKKTILDGYVLYLDVTKLVNSNQLTADSYVIAKLSDFPQRWSNILLACNLSGRLLSPVQALQNKLSRNYYGSRDLTVPITRILFFTPDNQDPIKIEDHNGNGATITFNKNTGIYSNNFSRVALFSTDVTFDLADGQSLILSWLDAPGGDPNGKLLTAGDFTIGRTSDASDYKHHLLLSYLGHKLVSHNVSLQIIIDRYYRKSMTKNDHNNVITVGQGHDYATIQAAVNAAADSKDNPVTILIMPGIYNESVKIWGQRHISLIGVNKKTCIVRNDTGHYNAAPLEIEGDVMVKNLTFIATHDATKNVPVDSLRSYAVHADFDGAGTAEFIDCDMISMQNAAFGSGLRQDQTIKLIRCNLFSHTPAESSMLINGSLFCHSAIAANTSNQHLIIDDCRVESDLSWAAYISDVNQTFGDKTGTDMDVTFYNTLFYSHEKGKTGVIHKDSGTGFSGTIKLNPMSYGNNLPELNG